MKKMGDEHNFGRFVYFDIDQSIVVKPKNLNFERLFLCENSQLRALFEKSVNNPFKYFPLLKYYKEGTVEYLELDQEDFELTTSVKESIGFLTAVAIFFGLDDLHYENIFFGNYKKNWSLFPIDVECIGANITLPTQTHLFKSKVIPLKKTGLFKLFKKVKDIRGSDLIEIANSYCTAIQALNEKINKINQILIDYKDAPVRVILRSTDIYKSFLDRNCSLIAPIKEEMEQLNRGDIPYFFWSFSSKDISYYTNCKLTQKSKILHNSEDKINIQPLKSLPFSKLSDQLIFISVSGLIASLIRTFNEVIMDTDSLSIESGIITVKIVGRTFKCKF